MARPEQAIIGWVVNSKALYGVIILAFAFYLLTRSPVFALLVAFAIIAEFIAETIAGAGKHGWKQELKEIGIAILAALIIWFGGGLLLQTPAPLNAVVSCSMLPNLDRGDMMVLQGSLPNAPEAAVSSSQWAAQDWASEQLWCGLCQRQNGTFSYYELCIGKPTMLVEDREGGQLRSYGVAVNETPQEDNLVQFGCGWCTVALDSGGTAQTPCARNVTIAGQPITENLGNDVIVYTAAPTDKMQGDIIHRVYARVNVDGKYYYLTKGDNNPQFDLQYGNAPAPQGRTSGRTVLRIPYLGYVKLFLFGHVLTPEGCDRRIKH